MWWQPCLLAYRQSYSNTKAFNTVPSAGSVAWYIKSGFISILAAPSVPTRMPNGVVVIQVPALDCVELAFSDSSDFGEFRDVLLLPFPAETKISVSDLIFFKAKDKTSKVQSLWTLLLTELQNELFNRLEENYNSYYSKTWSWTSLI